MIRRISSDQVPDEVKEQLVKLKKNVRDYILIGDSYYEIRPFSVIKLVNFLNEITSIITELKEDDYSKLTGQTENKISLKNILANSELKEKLINLIKKMLEGVDDVDLEAMNIAQFNELLTKIWNVNINAFPDEQSKNEFIAKIVSLMMLINPNLYRYAMNTQFIDDISVIMERNPELAKKINEELKKLYEERLKTKEETKH